MLRTVFVRGAVRALEMFSQSLTCQLGVPDAKNITVGCVCVCVCVFERDCESVLYMCMYVYVRECGRVWMCVCV